MINKEQITAVILAGGKSQRMGEDKAFLKLKNRSFLEHIIAAVQPLVREVVLIANEETYQVFDLVVYPDLIKNKGPVGGIYTAMKAVETPFLLVLSCDIPLVTTDLLQFLITNSIDCDANVLTINNALQPLTAMYKKTTESLFKRQLIEGKLKLKLLLEEMTVQEISCPSQFKRNLTNINTPNDFLTINDDQE